MEFYKSLLISNSYIYNIFLVSDFRSSKYFRKSVQDLKTDGDPYIANYINYSYNMMTEF